MDTNTIYVIEQRVLVNEQETTKLKKQVDNLAKSLSTTNNWKQAMNEFFTYAKALNRLAKDNEEIDKNEIIAITDKFIDLYENSYN